MERIDVRKLDLTLDQDANLRRQVETHIADILSGYNELKAMRNLRLTLVKEIADEVLGLGHLEEFLQDPEITEIMVNGADRVYVERGGRIQLTDRTFINDAQVLQILERILAPLGRRIDESSPMVDARLPDGSRVNAVIPPLAVDYPTVTIRKFAVVPFTLEDLIDRGMLDRQTGQLLAKAVADRKNIVISGGTGSGKTTLLNVLSDFIGKDERIITIEDAAELRLKQNHVIRLEARPPNIEGKGEVTIRDLVRNALRMRPDRIIVGEVRGGEALDMLQAMNTGHKGSLSTIHANSPKDAIARLETMVLMANVDLPLRAIRSQIASAIDLIVHTGRMPDGSRRVLSVGRIAGIQEGEICIEEVGVTQTVGAQSNREMGR
ncbi:MAG TPA: CpaF family protein [Firmicutes bacterium]|nr:CpaF family protein [Bacillota bacterium]